METILKWKLPPFRISKHIARNLPAFILAYTGLCVCIHMYICVCVFVYVCVCSRVCVSTYTITRGHHYKIFIARTHKLVKVWLCVKVYTFLSILIAPIWNTLRNTFFSVDTMSVFKHKLRDIDLIQLGKRH